MLWNSVLALVNVGLIITWRIWMLTVVGFKILSKPILMTWFEISLSLVVSVLNFALVRVKWLDWVLVLGMASGGIIKILIPDSRSWLRKAIVNWFWDWLKISEPFGLLERRPVFVHLSCGVLLVKSMLLGGPLWVMGDLLLMWQRLYEVRSNRMDWVGRSGIGGDRIAEGVGILVGVVAGMITGVGIKVLGFGVRGEVGAVFGMEGFRGGGEWRFVFF